jgi:hypothetical protein
MNSLTLYGLSKDWDENAYHSLLNAAQARGGYCVLAQRRGSADACARWIEECSIDLESSEEAMHWPGTIVHDDSDKATLLKFRVTPALVRSLRDTARTPFDWMGPDLPEDLSFLRADGTPWFVSIAHEKDAFFKLTDDEVEAVKTQLGGLELIAQGEDQVPEEKF